MRSTQKTLQQYLCGLFHLVHVRTKKHCVVECCFKIMKYDVRSPVRVVDPWLKAYKKSETLHCCFILLWLWISWLENGNCKAAIILSFVSIYQECALARIWLTSTASCWMTCSCKSQARFNFFARRPLAPSLCHWTGHIQMNEETAFFHTNVSLNVALLRSECATNCSDLNVFQEEEMVKWAT